MVDVLGHCGECHTPRGILGEMKLSRSLTGFALGRVAAPDITTAGLASRGWAEMALGTYLSRGIAGPGPPSPTCTKSWSSAPATWRATIFWP